MANIVINRVKAAVVFELDNVVRRIKPDIQRQYFTEHGMVPPAPTDLGEQELIEPVCAYIKRYMEQEGVMAIALDNAPYIEDGVVPWAGYELIKDETLKLLKGYGIKVAEFACCPHAPERKPIYDGKGREIDRLTQPKCFCHWPNPGLMDKLVELHKLNHVKEGVHYRMLRPNLGIGNTQEFRDMMVLKMGCNYVHVEAIKNGSIYNKELVTNAHIKAAAQIKDHQRHNLRERSDGSAFVENLDALKDVYRELPGHLNKPGGTK